MDFHSLPRRDLQSLCKKNRIPANMTNVAMADALQALQCVEGIGEIQESLQFQSPTKAELTSPALPRTSRRTSTRKPPATVEPKAGQASPLPRSRRVAVKASEIMRMAEVGEEGEKQEGTTKKVVVAETPRAPATRRRATKKEEGGKAAVETPAAPTTRRRAAKKEDKVEALEAESRKVEAVEEEKATVVLKTYQRSTRPEAAAASIGRRSSRTRATIKIEALVLEEEEDSEEKAVETVEESAASVDEKKSSEAASEEETKLPMVETEESSETPLEASHDEELDKECFENPAMENLIAEEEKEESVIIQEDAKLGNEEAEEEKQVSVGNGDQQLAIEQPNPAEESPIRGLIEEDPSSNPGNKEITTEEDGEEENPDLPLMERVLEFMDAQIPPVGGAESGDGETPAEIQESGESNGPDGFSAEAEEFAGDLAVEFNHLTLEEAIEEAMQQVPPPSDPIKLSDSDSAAVGYPAMGEESEEKRPVGPAVTAGGGEAEVKDKAEKRTVQDLHQISLRKLKSMYKEKMEGKKRSALMEINDNLPLKLT